MQISLLVQINCFPSWKLRPDNYLAIQMKGTVSFLCGAQASWSAFVLFWLSRNSTKLLWKRAPRKLSGIPLVSHWFCIDGILIRQKVRKPAGNGCSFFWASESFRRCWLQCSCSLSRWSLVRPRARKADVGESTWCERRLFWRTILDCWLLSVKELENGRKLAVTASRCFVFA